MKTQMFMRQGFFLGFAILALGLLGGYKNVEAQVSTSYPVMPCTVLDSNLMIGSYDPVAVVSLQNFLNARGYMSHTPTGYFGGLTYRAVVSFQASQGIIRTGYVGPLTRAAIQSVSCGTPPPIQAGVSIYSIEPSVGAVGTTVTITGRGFTPATNSIFFAGGAISNVSSDTTIGYACTNNPSCIPGIRERITFTIPAAISPYCPPNAMCAMYIRVIDPGTYPLYVSNENGTSSSVNLTVTNGAQGTPLSISGIDAPNSLPIQTPGTWTIHTTSNLVGTLHYSAVWGDEMYYPTAGIVAPVPTQMQSFASLSHTYIRTGTYVPQFTVTDDYGHSATASLSILVTPIY